MGRPWITSPRALARLELARAVGAALCVPVRYAAHFVGRKRSMAAIADDVQRGAGKLDTPPQVRIPTDRPLRIFLSAAEASGEIHAASLASELRKQCAAADAPEPTITTIGSERLRALGIEPIEDPVRRAQTGFDGVLQSLPYYVGVLRSAAHHAKETRPDVFVPVDSPALHVPMARVVRAAGVPVCHLVAPQYWGWAPGRVRAYRKAIDLALTILPHEPAWYARHGVHTRHVGHPLLDALKDTPATRPDERTASRTLAILPGSRAGVIRRNLPWMLAATERLRSAHTGVDVAILQASGEHAELIESIAGSTGARGVVGDLHGELGQARAAFAVSGTILTDVLHHRLPVVCVYRVAKRLEMWMYRNVLTCPYFASTNLLAGREVVPEHCFRGEGPKTLVAEQVERVFADEAVRAEMIQGLDEAATRLGPTGAIERSAAHVLAVASGASAR